MTRDYQVGHPMVVVPMVRPGVRCFYLRSEPAGTIRSIMALLHPELEPDRIYHIACLRLYAVPEPAQQITKHACQPPAISGKSLFGDIQLADGTNTVGWLCSSRWRYLQGCAVMLEQPANRGPVPCPTATPPIPYPLSPRATGLYQLDTLCMHIKTKVPLSLQLSAQLNTRVPMLVYLLVQIQAAHPPRTFGES